MKGVDGVAGVRQGETSGEAWGADVHTETGGLNTRRRSRPAPAAPAVLRHADVFVSHGGMNSVMESLLAVVPTVVVPERPEQKVNAARVAELGLGRRLTAGELSASALRDAATALLGDSPERAAVRGFRDRHLRGDGAIVAADAAEAFLARRAVAV
ncbi:hypothetical protein OG777_24250 [Micromonospora peucetia]|uniref:Glycosyltransferase, MGT family n=1 Tax=Micromonospora peucetia TaxID=47871 RepID=A0A1C6W587_9ACTN|nr:nucleotide disphospho-sugar-binding domain-containing protein [Micromonospora peucetia]MCX4390019.1 hypothetical protein [Micromonospora peucetia]SCL73534.1 glycosyltransferase, MGT family [Micromonospora peucetia]